VTILTSTTFLNSEWASFVAYSVPRSAQVKVATNGVTQFIERAIKVFYRFIEHGQENGTPLVLSMVAAPTFF
jgi:hypothetical protein